MIDVVFKSYTDAPDRGYWDQAFLEQIFEGEVWNPVNGYEWNITDLDKVDDGCILVIAARYPLEKIQEINDSIKNLRWVLVILASDEESLFPSEKLVHPNMMTYVMTPDYTKDLSHITRVIGEGFPIQARTWANTDSAKAAADKRDLDVYYSGQNNHVRRQQCIEALDTLDVTKLVCVSEGFTQGLGHEEYFTNMANSKVVACPSGPATVDSFRFFEALEYGCIPLADTLTPEGKGENYWQRLFNSQEPPFEIIRDWEHVGGNVANRLTNWRSQSNICFAWWQNYKREFVYNLVNDVHALSGAESEESYTADNVTVLVATSPIRSHPSTDIIQTTLDSIRRVLPRSEIFIMIDGVRPEQEYLRAEYEQYIGRLLWMINTEYTNILPVLAQEFNHQSGMTRMALPLVKTPNIMFVEHDTPLIGDIDISSIIGAVNAGGVDLVRLHHETHVLVEHEHMMIDTSPIQINGVGLMKTVQWSQRPHVASKAFYERILRNHFTENAKTMIEDVMHGVVHSAFLNRAGAGWSDFRLWMYTPDVNDMKRSDNLDGRKDEEKYGMTP